MTKLANLIWQGLLIGATPLALAAVKGKASKSKKTPPAKAKPADKKSARPATKPARQAKPAPKSKVAPPAKTNASASKRAPAVPVKAVASKTNAPTNAPATKAEVLPKPPAPTGRAILLAPEGGKFADSINPRFRWLSVGGATRYQIEWSDKSDFTDGHSITSIATEAVVPVEQPLALSVTYYWHVRGGNEGGWGPWSGVASFRVLESTE